MHPTPHILAIGASPRKGGNCDVLIEHFLHGAQSAGATTTAIQLRDCSISPCIGCEQCRKTGICTRFDDDMRGIYDQIQAARGLLLVSPVHNYNVTAWMKAFIDRLYCFYDFTEPRPGPWSSRLAGQGRKAVVAAVAEQRERKDMGFTLEAMQLPLEALGYAVIQQLPVLGVFPRGKLAELPEVVASVRQAGAQLAQGILTEAS